MLRLSSIVFIVASGMFALQSFAVAGSEDAMSELVRAGPVAASVVSVVVIFLRYMQAEKTFYHELQVKQAEAIKAKSEACHVFQREQAERHAEVVGRIVAAMERNSEMFGKAAGALGKNEEWMRAVRRATSRRSKKNSDGDDVTDTMEN